MSRRQGLLSIGEISKLTGASLRSLRYYEKLGLLTPAYIEPDSGYRYYSVDQTTHIELIRFCVELDIPLKEFGKFVDAEDTIDYRAFLAQGKEIAQKKLNALKQGLALIDEMERHMDFADRYQTGQFYERECAEKLFYTMPCGDSLVGADLAQVATVISETAHAAYADIEYDTLPEHGVLCEYTPNGAAYYAFVEIPQHMADSNTKIVPAGTYLCRQSDDTQLEQVADVCKEYLTGKTSFLAIETAIFTGKHKLNKPLHELRVIGGGFN
ncbi:MAG: MerR family transcriptional regulator [Oscillospiraceae bacterium]|nr:MerR family transcriptional regulator [Oscillospiraceae bacterium]